MELIGACLPQTASSEWLGDFYGGTMTQSTGKRFSQEYLDYLASDAWQAKRAEALERAGRSCQLCNTDDDTLDVHHSTYERFGDESPQDLIVLCRPCHEAHHARQDHRSAPVARPRFTVTQESATQESRPAPEPKAQILEEQLSAIRLVVADSAVHGTPTSRAACQQLLADEAWQGGHVLSVGDECCELGRYMARRFGRHKQQASSISARLWTKAREVAELGQDVANYSHHMRESVEFGRGERP